MWTSKLRKTQTETQQWAAISLYSIMTITWGNKVIDQHGQQRKQSPKHEPGNAILSERHRPLSNLTPVRFPVKFIHHFFAEIWSALWSVFFLFQSEIMNIFHNLKQWFSNCSPGTHRDLWSITRASVILFTLLQCWKYKPIFIKFIIFIIDFL